ncbi:hypothetical protein BDY21DRAFT_385940 [Lineolata rhizophorae]|uniref:Caib baif family enzyme n=1 Tax=Lineolata rhizophorae TaxID=578093 RepID=A0A6A6NZB3_9PEZI|nr:hypothetical protein BDY21DRAFT_385940 [Lineolata rhizophorae]
MSSSLEPVCHIVTPVGMLGYGLDAAQTEAEVSRFKATGVPTAIILDSGSTDGGPSKLALGGTSVPRSSYVRDLRKLLRLTRLCRVPLMFTSAGGAGTDENVREILGVIEELVAEIKDGSNKLKVNVLYAGVPKDLVRQRLRAGAITGCGPTVPPMTESDIDDAPIIVAQMGPEPLVDAMQRAPDFDVLVAGRAYDPSCYIAFADYCYRKDHPNGTANDKDSLARRIGGITHMGKIMECGGLCGEPKGGGACATVYMDGTFDIVPLNPSSRCTPVSVAAHTLYEKTRPDKLHGPGGYLDLTNSNMEQLDDGRTVRARGGVFFFSKDEGRRVYQAKLEGAKSVGYRSIYVGAHKDPILISQKDSFLSTIRHYVTMQHEGVPGTWELGFHVYGKGREGGEPGEICLVGEALGSTQELADSVAATAKVATIHAPYFGQKATSGNFAFGIGGKQIFPLGECAEFCVYHLMDLKDGEERLPAGGTGPLFRMETVIFGADQGVTPSSNGQTPPVENDTATASKKKSNMDEIYRRLASKMGPLPPNPTLGDAAKVIRSKNAGPYEITFDVMFELEEVYRAIKDSAILDDNVVANLFGISANQVIWSGFYDQARAYKVTIPRIRNGKPVPSGGFMEDDVHGSQMYLPLMHFKLPTKLGNRLQEIVSRHVNSKI